MSYFLTDQDLSDMLTASLLSCDGKQQLAMHELQRWRAAFAWESLRTVNVRAIGDNQILATRIGFGAGGGRTPKPESSFANGATALEAIEALRAKVEA